MIRIQSKYQAAREEIKRSVSREQTPKIPGLRLRPGTGTALVPPVPANLPLPNPYQMNPRNMSGGATGLSSLRHLPWRLTLWQASVLSGYSEYDLRELIAQGHIPVLNQGAGTTIYISSTELMAIMANPEVVRKLTRIINRFHRVKSAEKARRRAERGAGGRQEVGDRTAPLPRQVV